MWTKHVTRRLAVQIAQAWNYGIGVAMKKKYGVWIKDTLVFRDDRKTDYYFNKAQFKRYERGLYRLLGNSKFIKTFHGDALETLKRILKSTQDRLSDDLSSWTNRKLVKIYSNLIWPQQAQFYVRMWNVFNIGDPLAQLVLQSLRKYVGDEKQAAKYLLIFSNPLKPNDVLCERMDLLRLALQKNKLSRVEFLKKISHHTRKYQHIPMFDFDHQPYTEEHFLQEIKAIRNPQRELKRLITMFNHRQKEFSKTLKEIKPDEKLKALLVFLKENVWLRDYRDMLRQKVNLALRKFYKEVGQRLGLSISQVALLTDQEIVSYLTRAKSFPKSGTKRRERAYLLIQRGTQAKLYSGQQALRVSKRKLRLIAEKKIKQLTGITGSLGRARGVAKIVYTNRDLYKVKQGNVLIAAMTRQDFVTALRKAVAIVTDEGGVTCHAAIICRELEIPCVVGTKVATRIFRDGDRVEVDANKGIIKKI